MRRCRRAQGGHALLAAMLAICLVSVALLGAALGERLERQRANERALLFIGQQFEQAILRYANEKTVSARELPTSLDDLLEDRRGPRTVRHLRRLYVDPMTGTQDWGLIKDGDRLVGVFSRSGLVPVHRWNLPLRYRRFEKAKTLRDWTFSIQDPRPAASSADGAPDAPNANP